VLAICTGGEASNKSAFVGAVALLSENVPVGARPVEEGLKKVKSLVFDCPASSIVAIPIISNNGPVHEVTEIVCKPPTVSPEA
jgi:hypothetical protein